MPLGAESKTAYDLTPQVVEGLGLAYSRKGSCGCGDWVALPWWFLYGNDSMTAIIVTPLHGCAVMG